MPIEIRELVIKATIESKSTEEPQQTGEPGIDQEDLIARCVEQVMELLKETKER